MTMQRPATPYKRELYHEAYEIYLAREVGSKTVKTLIFDTLFVEDAEKEWNKVKNMDTTLIAVMDYEKEDGRLMRRKYVWVPVQQKWQWYGG